MLWLAACAVSEPTPPPGFDEAVHLAFRTFESASDAELAQYVLAMETEIDASLDLAAVDLTLRSFTPTPLTVEDVAGVDVPDRDPSLALTSALVRQSLFPRADHLPLPLIVDQTPLEPQCPEHYVRSFVAGEACWPDCVLRTSNDLTKTNLLFRASYVLPKEYRPFEVGDGRTATFARTWTTDRVVAEEAAAVIEQSESIEFWLDRPDGSGALRMMAVFSETTFAELEADDPTVEATLRLGTDQIFARQDEWLSAN